METDVLIVGGGGAGLRAAIGAKERGVEVILVNKGPHARSGATPLAGADLTVDGKSLRRMGFFGEPRDSKEIWFKDIIQQGFYLNNQKLVEIYVNDAPDRVQELIDWGLQIRASEERAIFTTGTAIMDVLFKRAKEMGIEMISDTMVIDILTKKGRVTGALALDIPMGEFIAFKAKAIILATGGWHKAYWPNAGSRELSGDGIAAAYRVGAELANMEFVTFACNIPFWPPRWIGHLIGYLLHMQVGGKLINNEGEEILSKYDPIIVKIGSSTEWNKCFISFASQREVIDGKGSPHGGIFYTYGDMPWETFDSKVCSRFPNWRFKGQDLSELREMLKEKGSIEVGPAAEYFEGGILVNEHFETNVPGLYAAGECTTSLFGANRVSAATTEMLVEGARAGWFAAEYVKKIEKVEMEEKKLKKLEGKAIQPLIREDGAKPAALRGLIQRLAQERLGPIRDHKKLKGLIGFIEMVKREELPRLYTSSNVKRYNKEWIEALELENIVLILEASARSALKRTESRGVHYRSDHPYTDNDSWLKEILVKQVDGKPYLNTRPITITSLTPPKGVSPYLEMMKRMMLAHSPIGGHH